LLTRKGDRERLVLYWHEAGGETFSGEIGYRIFQVIRLALRDRTDGAIIRVATPVLEDENVELATKRIKEFGAYPRPALASVLPR